MEPVEVFDDVYDQEYVMILSEIDTRLNTLRKHDRVRIVAWIKKLNMITTNKMWKKNRNLYSFLILDMILKNEFEEPINKFPPEGHLSVLSQTAIKTRLSNNIVKALPPIKSQYKTMDSVNNNNLNQNEGNKEQISNININNLDPRLNNTNDMRQDNNQQLVNYENKSSEEKNYSNDFNSNEREEHKNINQLVDNESKVIEDKTNIIPNNNSQELSNDDDTMKFTFMNPKDKLNYLNKLLEAKNNDINILLEERNILVSEIQGIENQIKYDNNSNDKVLNTKVKQNGTEKLGQVKGSVGKIPNRHYFNSTNNTNKDKVIKK